METTKEKCPSTSEDPEGHENGTRDLQEFSKVIMKLVAPQMAPVIEGVGAAVSMIQGNHNNPTLQHQVTSLAKYDLDMDSKPAAQNVYCKVLAFSQVCSFQIH